MSSRDLDGQRALVTGATSGFMAQRIHAHITNVKAGHLSMVANPSVIAKVITAAAKATS